MSEELFMAILREKLENGFDPCPECGKPLRVVSRDDFLRNGIIVRHACPVCGLLFKPDGSREPFVSAIEARAQVEIWKAEKHLFDEASFDAVKEAEALLISEGVDNG